MSLIRKCVLFTNGMVAAFDEKGKQIPEYQGFILDVAEKLKTGCDENTVFGICNYESWLEIVDFSWYWRNGSNEK